MHPQSASCVIEEVTEEASPSATEEISSAEPSAVATEQAAAQAEPSTCAPAEPDTSQQRGAANGSAASEEPVDGQLQQVIADCERLKLGGNALYAKEEYDEALQLYWQVIHQHMTLCACIS